MKGQDKINLELRSHAQVNGLLRIELRRHLGKAGLDEFRYPTTTEYKIGRRLVMDGDRSGFLDALHQFWPELTLEERERFWDGCNLLWGENPAYEVD